MILTDAIDPPDEPCVEAAPPVAAPEQFVNWQEEGRLAPALREAAQTQDPYKILARAAAAFYFATHPAPPPTPQGSVALGNALADLAVTGRVSYERFKATPLNEAALVAATRARPGSPGLEVPEEAVKAVKMALDRAYDVAWSLRGPVTQRAAARQPLGWIATSGEDDTPHRPVNIAPPPFEQFELPVTTHGVTVQTRFFIASAVEAPAPAVTRPSTRALPPDPVPHVPDGHRVILFLHGHSSSAEEALTLIPHIHAAGLEHGTKYSIISLDLPNNGYSQTFDHTTVAPLSATSFPHDPWNKGRIFTPILDYIEDFVVAFVDALDRITPIKSRFAGVIGGSLGGNLGLRLGRRDLAAHPWLAAGIVSWSAASVWPPMVQNLITSQGPDRCLKASDVGEDELSRVEYFRAVYDIPLLVIAGFAILGTQPQMWYRDGWPCKGSHVAGSRRARQETYNANFRRWHWRVAGEQLLYSHVDWVDHSDENTPQRFELNRVRQLLIAGEKDNYLGTTIFDATRTLSAKMVQTPGRSLFLNNTGHSIHFERPRFLAGEIANFLIQSEPARKTTDISFLTPLLLSEPARKRTDISFLTPLLLGPG